MTNSDRSCKESYTEAEAAATLGITVARLHQILDQHVFNQGNDRPESIELNSNDLSLLRYWNKSTKSPRRVIEMPKRK